MTVLVIDDSDLARTSLVRAFAARGMEAVELASPIGATSMILRRAIRAVILDVNMPSVQGDKLAALFRRNPRLAHVKLVLLSGMAHGELQQLAAAVGADAAVTKSDGNEAVVDVVRGLLAES